MYFLLVRYTLYCTRAHTAMRKTGGRTNGTTLSFFNKFHLENQTFTRDISQWNIGGGPTHANQFIMENRFYPGVNHKLYFHQGHLSYGNVYLAIDDLKIY